MVEIGPQDDPRQGYREDHQQDQDHENDRERRRDAKALERLGRGGAPVLLEAAVDDPLLLVGHGLDGALELLALGATSGRVGPMAAAMPLPEPELFSGAEPARWLEDLKLFATGWIGGLIFFGTYLG